MGNDGDGDATYLYQLAKRSPHEPPGPVALAIALLGRADAVLEVDPREVWGDGELVPDGDHWQIHVSTRLGPERFSFVVAHEIAEWHLKQTRFRVTNPAEKELYCDAIGAALLAPREAFCDAVGEHGDSFADLARDFATTETLVALRYGEVRHVPLVVVGPTIRVRGPEWTWGTEEDVRRMARDHERPGLRKTRLTDDPRRVVLMA